MTTPDELAIAWVSARGLDANPDTLAMARRRVFACGRLATVEPLLHVAGVVRVEVQEHGIALVPAGCAIAQVWVLAGDAEQLQAQARRVHEAIKAGAWASSQLVVAAVHRASRLDRFRAWLAWRLRG